MFSVQFHCPFQTEALSHLLAVFPLYFWMIFHFQHFHFYSQYSSTIVFLVCLNLYYPLIIAEDFGDIDFTALQHEKWNTSHKSSNDACKLNCTILSISDSTHIWERVFQNLPDACCWTVATATWFSCSSSILFTLNVIPMFLEHMHFLHCVLV